MQIKQADFVKSAVYEVDYPEELGGVEFAFVGMGVPSAAVYPLDPDSPVALQARRDTCDGSSLSA